MTDALARARRLLGAHPLIDGHNDLPWAIRMSRQAGGDPARYDLQSAPPPGETDLPRLRAGGLGGQFWSVYVPGEAGVGLARMQLEQIDLARRLIAAHPADLALCWSAADAEAAFGAGRIASMLGMEGGHVLEGSLGALRAFHELGARYLTLTHSTTNELGDSATDEPRHGGLSPFGRQVVAEMNRLGMLVDLSHVATTTMADALEASAAPVIFSHSSARALCDVPRNVPDEILARMPANGGVVMVNFVAGFISPDAAAVLVPAIAEFGRRSHGTTDPEKLREMREEYIDSLEVPAPTIDQVADHVEHVARVAGHSHVGIGADYDGNRFWPAGMEDVSSYPRLFAELISRGWTDEQLAALAGGNVLRVMRGAEQVATAAPPSLPR
ncbi:MAG TPA: dipeptidase [Candidatus Limnocylindrales bacterium]|nr:dipeptidase [Candidatus Limnocylindrales bacterium]